MRGSFGFKIGPFYIRIPIKLSIVALLIVAFFLICKYVLF